MKLRANIKPKLIEDEVSKEIPNMFFPTIFLILFFITTIYLKFYVK